MIFYFRINEQLNENNVIFLGTTLTDDEKQELEEIRSFRHQTLQLYLSTLDGRTSWSTLIQVFIYMF